MVPVRADEPKVGAATPFVTLEAEDGELAGGANVRRFELGSPVPDAATLELEASGGALVQLANDGAAVSWRNPVQDANSIVIRASIPDAPNGGGIDATLNLYVNGKFRQALPLSSKQSWVYRGNGWNNDPHSGGMPFKFYNEDRALISGPPLARGDVLSLRKEAGNTAAAYQVDCVDLEHVGPPLARPAGSISILDFGADPTGKTDSQAAIQKAMDEARQRGATLWIPPGRFVICSVIPTGLDFKGLTVQGAGMWHSMLYRKVPFTTPEAGQRWRSFIKAGARTTIRDLSIDANGPTRFIGTPGGSDYGILASGDGWLIQRVWVQHCDAQWLSGTNGIIRDSRVADSWGDGINLNNSNKPNPDSRGINLRAENNFVRGSGDDGFATYSDGGDAGDNPQMEGATFVNNTSIAPYWANSLRVAGGRNVVVRNNLLTDSASNSGMTVGVFGKSGNALESALIEGNVILRGGGWNGKNRHGLSVGSKQGEYSNVIFRNNVIQDSRRAGISIGPTSERLVFENNRIVHPATAGIVVEGNVEGTATFSGNSILNLNPGQPNVVNGSEKTFTVTMK